MAAIAAAPSRTVTSTAASVYYPHEAALLPETTARREIIPRHANSIFPAHEEALEMARPPLDRPIPTPLLPLLLRHHFVEASAAAVVEEISNFEVAVVAGEI